MVKNKTSSSWWHGEITSGFLKMFTTIYTKASISLNTTKLNNSYSMNNIHVLCNVNALKFLLEQKNNYWKVTTL